jgi:type 2 lantibiotic biosynthesis protein LanM
VENADYVIPDAIIDDELRSILNCSASLYDRLSGRFVPEQEPLDEGKAAEVLAKWQQRATGNDAVKFERRLAWEGHNRQSIRPILGKVQLAPGIPIPVWLKLLAACATGASSASADGIPPKFLDDKRRMPYEEVFAPYVRTADELLKKQEGRAGSLLSEAARINLLRTLLSHLTAISTVVLEHEYSLYRNRHCSSLWRLAAMTGDDSSRAIYLEFVESILADGLKSLFREYAVLGRLIGTSIENWLSWSAEFLRRLENDLPYLASEFHDSKPLGLVEQLQMSLSDPHNGGRSVIRVSFADGFKLIYKPKDLTLEQTFADWLGWLNQEGLPLEFKPLRLLCRPGYGWVEFVPHAPCADEAGGKKYYIRAGMLLGLAYFMEATDCHHENVIAAGEFPQLIDVETLMHQDYRQVGANEQFEAAAANASTLAQDLIWNSVLRTLFLPQWFIDKSGDTYDVSGFAAQGLRPNVPVLKNINSDHMHLVMEPATPALLANQPFLSDGSPLPALACTRELVAGFREIYHFILNRKALLLSEDGPLNKFAQQRIRYVLRPTRVYALLLKKAYWPEFLRDGMDRSIELDAVSRGFLHSSTRPAWWQAVEADHRALDQLDIPFYSVRADSRDLEMSIPGTRGAAPKHAVVPGFFGKTGFGSMKAIIRKANLDDLALQEQFIRMSFYAHEAKHGISERPLPKPDPAAEEEGPLLSPGEMVEEAVRIAETLAASAIRAADGSVAWLGMSFKPGTDRYQFRTIGDSLFAGCAGVSLFLAAVARVTGDLKYRNLALAAVKTLRGTLRDGLDYWSRESGLGGFSGSSSVAYALSGIGSLLEMQELQLEAVRLAHSITTAQIEADPYLDVTLGSAGALLVLLALYQKDGNSGLLDLALQCGEKILRERKPFGDFGVWVTVDKEALTGFSHGAAGFAYALRRLYQASGQARFQEAADGAVAFEDSLFQRASSNWPDLRRPPNSRGERYCMTAWCHGAGGIALSRLATLPLSNAVNFRRDAEIGMNTLEATRPGALDHLCCGTLGLAAILRRGGEELNLPHLSENAQRKATAVARSARAHDGLYALFYDIPRTVPNPGLMQGVSGIGYSLLQMGSALKEMPDILLLNL